MEIIVLAVVGTVLLVGFILKEYIEETEADKDDTDLY